MTVELEGSRSTCKAHCSWKSARRPRSTPLGVGDLTEEVTVTAQTVLESSNANRGDVIDNRRIAELPLQSRSPIALATLVAGVNYNAQAIYLRPFDNGALADFSMNGGANRNNEFLLDGAPNNANQDGNNIAYVPPAEAVQEFKIATNTYDAQYGRSAGGVVNMSLKSGTNSLHGVGYEFMRRKWLDSNSFLLNSRDAPKTDHYLDQYGFSVDGPVRIPGLYNGMNKTFFLFTGERYREGTPAPLFNTTPTEAMRNGDFSNYRDVNGNLIQIYDPATGRNVNGTWVRDPFPGNIIPADRINPVAARDHAVLPPAEQHDGRRRALAAEPRLRRPDQQGRLLELGRQGRSQHQRKQPDVLPLGRERAQRVAQHPAHPQRARAGRPTAADPLQRAIVGDWVHIMVAARC